MLDRGVLRTAPQLARPVLVRAALATPVTLLEAPGGSGKTTLAALVARELDRPTVRAVVERDVPLAAALVAGARRSGLTALGDGDVVAALLDTAPDRPVLVVVDEVQRATPADLDLVLQLAATAGPGHQLLVLGRRLDHRLVAYAADHELAVIDAEALRFTRGEVADVLASLDRDPASAEAIHRATDGWPAAVVLAARASLDPAVYATTDVVDTLVRHLLDELDPADRLVVARVGALSPLSAEVAEAAAGPGALDLVLDAGLPLRLRADGWAEVSDPVRDALAPRGSIDAETARAVSAAYRRGGEPLAAVRLLLERDDLDGTVELLAAMPWATLARVPVGYLDLVLGRLDDDRLADHGAILAAAALAADHVDPGRRRAWLERGRLITRSGPGRRAVLAELGRDLQREMRYDEAAPLLAEVLDAATEDEARTRGRALLADGLRRLVLDQADVAPETVERLERAAAELGLAGEHRLEAAALATVGYGVHFTAGRLDLAEEQLARALALLGAPDLARATQLPYLADVVRERGDLDRAEALLGESLSIGVRLGSTQTVGYAHWSLAWLAAERRDALALAHHLDEARRHGDPWYDGGAGIDFLAHEAEMRLLVGDPQAALVAIVECERRSAGTGYDWPALSVRTRYEATYGDTDRARALLEELEPIGAAKDRPLRRLLRAVVEARSGGDAAPWLAEADLAAASTGDPERLRRREPELVALAGGPTTPVPTRTLVRVLGSFEVWRGAEPMTPVAGLPSTLVKQLAVLGPRHVEQVVDAFWPEADLDTGRARLRNLLNRIRATSPDLVVRQGEALSLSPEVDVDLAQVEEAAAEVVAADRTERVGLARAALGRLRSVELLPGDPYADWLEPAREGLRRSVLHWYDLVADDALERHDFDDAVELLGRAIDLAPDEPSRYVAAAQALAVQGRARSAHDLAARGLAALADLGVSPDPRLQALTRPA